MSNYVLPLHEVDRPHLALVGGKGANLGELSRLKGIHVPTGFCVTTDAFQIGMREDVEQAIRRALRALGDQPVAVRSSATAEDLPDASFAGQHDTYLNVVGADAVVNAVRQCWASLFTERAIAYRNEHHFDPEKIRMAVVVQAMVPAEVAGVLFTADPVTSNRKVSSIEAVRGLGESLVSGMANADRYRVRGGEIVERNGTTLSEDQILRLERVGRQIEAHFGRPQDIEWCLVDDQFWIVQSRPITTLFPIPEASDAKNHVYVSVGHSQMMTDAMRPLGLSFWQLIAGRPMHSAGGRLFVDLTKELASPTTRDATVAFLGRGDPLIQDALETIVARSFVEPVPAEPPRPGAPPPIYNAPTESDPAVVADLIARSEAELETLKRDIATRSGTALFDFVRAHIEETKKQSAQDQRNIGAIMASVNAAAWINEKMLAWLGEKNAADTLAQSAPNNVTSSMGLDLLDVADVVRAHPAAVAYLQGVTREDFLDALPSGEVRDAIRTFLDKYGMRCAGEIDITRPRWSEKPTTLVPLILSNVKNFEPGAAQRKFDQGRDEAMRLRDDLLRRLRELPDGEQKANETERMIDQLRSFCGYREYPKYAIVNRYFVYKQALLREAERLVQAGVIGDVEDVYFLTFDELREVVGTHQIDPEIIRRRRAEHERFEKLSPPRVMTSDGEIVPGAYRRGEVPTDAIVGLAVSTGVVEGRARVLRDMAGAHLEPGDILVTRFTDPSWTPVFVSIAGLVTEVGGLMTHGAVIAREYGLPAVVGVENATQRIRDGQRIRVNGTDGYVELLA